MGIRAVNKDRKAESASKPPEAPQSGIVKKTKIEPSKKHVRS
jgi:hypothetical protein